MYFAGRHLLLGGRRGHLAAFDWLTKKLHTEIEVHQTLRDVRCALGFL